MNEEKRIRCSKFLALILRHQPESVGLTLEPEGWAPIDDVLNACHKKNRALTFSELEELLALDEKKRYSLDESRTKIRANQGHSTAVELTFEERTPPDILYHGTVERFLPSIFEQGLKPGSRHHVHLTESLETAQKVGARRGKPVILTVDAKAMSQARHRFYISENDVWLTDAVPPVFLTRDG
jgi:putative RNA 2'-phosphotransferase